MHYQIKQPQAKLVRIIAGEVFDVAVDLRRSSLTFGQWIGVTLSAHDKRQMWIPIEFAHGFVVRLQIAECMYKTTDYWYQEHERCVLWNDPDVGIKWPMTGDPVLSEKDKKGVGLKEAEVLP